MHRLSNVLVPNAPIDRVLLGLLGVLWLWKVLEVVGREAHLLRRNLGWGYYVDLDIPVAFTVAVGLFFLVRRLARPRR